MQKISSSHLKQNIAFLQNALRSDVLVTKQSKPFVVVMDYQKYKMFENKITPDLERVLLSIKNSFNDIEQGRMHPIETLWNQLDD